MAPDHSFAEPVTGTEATPENELRSIPPFATTLANHGIQSIRPSGIDILQINTGYRCNLRCSHCHVDAGPDRTEVMGKEIMQQCIEVLKTNPIGTVDITGGAPEMNPDFCWFIDEIRKAAPDIEILVRTNLTILVGGRNNRDLPLFLRNKKVNLIASLPCHTAAMVDRQRGAGVFARSIEALKMLNGIGYGTKESTLELSLVYNPTGATLPGCQHKLEEQFRTQLQQLFGITFTRLYTITNMPISRFLDKLNASGGCSSYMDMLSNAFNPAAVDALMCRNTISVRWDGRLYDCDFNQMLDLPVASSAPSHIRDFDREKLLSRLVTIGQHCYGCTAGAGSSCQGSLL
jgi:radical SAM/Cys-rich protein